MFYKPSLAAVAATLLLALPASAEGLYSKDSPVLQVNQRNFDRLILQSNHSAIIEFYAPWCGHCKNLKPEYEKAARALKGLAKVAAVNCDEDENKALCARFEVKGFPTLKLSLPALEAGGPRATAPYDGPREAKPIVEHVKSKMRSYVQKIEDSNLDWFLNNGNSSVKAILFTEKGATSALMKAVAIDFLGTIVVAQIRSKSKQAVELFGIEKFPSLVVLPGNGDTQGVLYDGEFRKEQIMDFLSRFAVPNQDPPPPKAKVPKDKSAKDKKKMKAEKEAKAEFESASSSHASSEGTAAAASATAETLEEASKPTASPDPIVEHEIPIIINDFAPPLPTLNTGAELAKSCLDVISGTCVLAFVPSERSDGGESLLTALAEIAHKYATSKRQIFPFYIVPSDNPESPGLKEGLGLSNDIEVIAINRKRGWWRQLETSEKTVLSVEQWIDAIRMGEGAKQKLPGVLLMEKTPESEAQNPIIDLPPVERETAAEPEPESTAEATASEETEPTKEATAEPTVAHIVDEL